MKLTLTLALASLLAATSFAETPAETLSAAAKKLSTAANYSWSTVTEVAEGSRWKPGPAEGKANADGYASMISSFGDRKMEMLLKDGKSVSKTDDGWKTPEEQRAAREASGGGGGGEGRPRGGGGGSGRMAQMFRTPAASVEELAKLGTDLKQEGDVISGDITTEEAKRFAGFGRRDGGSGGDAPAPPETKGLKVLVKVWLKDGAIAKMERKVSGKMVFGENERDLDQTVTTEIKDVGTTKLDVPEEAKTKLSEAAKAAPAKVKLPESGAEPKKEDGKEGK